MKITWQIVAAVGLVMVACWSVRAEAPATAKGTDTAKAVVEKLAAEGIAIMRDGSLTAEQKSEKVRKIAYDNMDFDTLARLSLGRYWRGLTDAQRADFVVEFKKHVTSTYSHILSDYTDEDVNVTGARAEEDGDWTVLSKIIGTKNGTRQEIAKVDYRMRKKDNQWKLIDFSIDGVSLVTNFRSQFQDIMAKEGIDKLLQLLREKNAGS